VGKTGQRSGSDSQPGSNDQTQNIQQKPRVTRPAIDGDAGRERPRVDSVVDRLLTSVTVSGLFRCSPNAIGCFEPVNVDS